MSPEDIVGRRGRAARVGRAQAGGHAAEEVAAADPAHRADRRAPPESRRPRSRRAARARARARPRASSSARDDQQQQQRSVVDLRRQPELQVHAGQPRHDEPVLHPDPERRGRRVQAARLLLPVDRVGQQRRRRHGQRVQHRGQRRRRRDRRRADQPDGVQRSRSRRRWRPASRWSPTTRTRRQPRVWPTSARTCSSPARRWASTSCRSCPRATVALFIAHAGRGQHPAADRRRAGHAQVLTRASSRTSSRPERRSPGAVDDRGLGHRTPERQGVLRGRRRQHAEHRRRRSRSTA